MKKLLLCFFATLLSCSLVACTSSKQVEETSVAIDSSEYSTESDNQNELVTLTVGVPATAPALPVLHMLEINALGDNVTIELDIWDDAETLIAMVQDGNHDFFAFPLTVVSKLYNKGLNVRLMNVNTWGITYFMTSDLEFSSWSDLKGKTLYVPLQSSPPDALTQYFLEEAGLTVSEDVTIIYASTSEIAIMLASGEAQYATLLEPQVTKVMMENSNVRIAYSFEEEWQRVNNTETKIPNAGFGTTQTFIDKNAELTAAFQKAYEEATAWVNENPEEAGVLAKKYLGVKATLIEKSLPTMGMSYKTAIDSKEELDMFYNLLNGFNPEMIGGKIPDEAMYYEAE